MSPVVWSYPHIGVARCITKFSKLFISLLSDKINHIQIKSKVSNEYQFYWFLNNSFQEVGKPVTKDLHKVWTLKKNEEQGFKDALQLLKEVWNKKTK